jgi:hypothetical protein
MRRPIRLVTPIGVIFGLTLEVVPVGAQVVVSPDSVIVVLPQGSLETRVIDISQISAVSLGVCFDVVEALQRSGQTPQPGSGCPVPGTTLQVFDDGDLGHGWSPRSLTSGPNNRLFIAEYIASPAHGTTHEVTPQLEHIREFDHPVVAELSPFPTTEGITYNVHTGTLWWTNAEVSGLEVRRVMLLEGNTDGVATGRRIVLPIPPEGKPPSETGFPTGAAYDVASALFYYVDAINNTLWAIDTLGVVPAGYPVRLARYPGTYYIGDGVDVHGGDVGGPEGVRIETPIGFEFSTEFDLVTVTDPTGADLGIETPLPIFPNDGLLDGYTLRSRVDPNRVMYAPFASFGPTGIVAFTPSPLSPTWLTLSDWSGMIPAGGSMELSLTFRAGQRDPGEYHTTLLVEDTTGLVLAEVPLTLVVEPGTPAEPAPCDAAPLECGTGRFYVAPNPSMGSATATLDMPATGRVILTVHDVLGRQVAVAHDAALAMGRHDLPLDRLRLDPGVYLLVARGDFGRLSTTMTIAR